MDFPHAGCFYEMARVPPDSAAPCFKMNPPLRYAQFGKRFLDGFSWLAPVTNNRLGDALNIELVHEQLFVIEGDRVLRNIGYSEKGTRFSEEDFGKPIHTLEDLAKNGYWLVGRPFHAEAVDEALEGMDDGHYYSFFSNQCQDWADRLRRRLERVEKARSLTPLPKPDEEKRREHFWKEKAPTVPASAALGLLAIALGIGCMLAPAVAAQRSIWVLAAFLAVSGFSEIVYAFHGRAWKQILPTLCFAGLNLAAALALFLDTQFAAKWAGGIFALVFGFDGLARVVVALRSRPFLPWLASLVGGLAAFTVAVLLLTKTVGQRDLLFAVLIGCHLILGGFSTLWLRWSARNRE